MQAFYSLTPKTVKKCKWNTWQLKCDDGWFEDLNLFVLNVWFSFNWFSLWRDRNFSFPFTPIFLCEVNSNIKMVICSQVFRAWAKVLSLHVSLSSFTRRKLYLQQWLSQGSKESRAVSTHSSLDWWQRSWFSLDIQLMAENLGRF